MVRRGNRVWPLLAIVGLVVSMVMCGPGGGEATSTLTPTLTATLYPPGATDSPGGPGPSGGTATPTVESIVGPTVEPTAETSPCEGLSASLEVKVLVGPAAAVGLETHGVGSVPLSVTSGGPPYGVEGGGHISYHEVLTEDEIEYDVTFEADVVFDGTCEDTPGSTQLVLDLDMAWNQVVEVTAPDFHQVYPVAGDNTAIVTLPLIDGATASVGGEGMEVVLHLGR
jgi:hypothetical protein